MIFCTFQGIPSHENKAQQAGNRVKDKGMRSHSASASFLSAQGWSDPIWMALLEGAQPELLALAALLQFPVAVMLKEEVACSSPNLLLTNS